MKTSKETQLKAFQKVNAGYRKNWNMVFADKRFSKKREQREKNSLRKETYR